ncbi:MAG: hypothetical protein JWQ74_1532 [Marmoricola sp.]|nr:hypothetical protein [Marmoricola sp.]
MESGHRARGAVRRHAGRPGPWAQLPMLLLGMMFVAALVLSGYQPSTGGPGGADNPTGNSADIANPAPGSR